VSGEDKCGNCGRNMEGYEFCSNCGWRRITPPPAPPKNWPKLLAAYAALLAVFGACGFATYFGVSTLFGFGPLHDSLVVKIVAWAILLGVAAKRLMRRYRR